MEWTINQGTGLTHENHILRLSDDAYISYNARPGGAISFFRGDTNDGETAIVLKKQGARTKFLILNGDFRKEYEEAAKRDGIGGCLAFYEAHKDKRSSWSSDYVDEILKF